MINTRVRLEKYERQRARRNAYTSRKRRGMTRSNLGIRRKGPASRSLADWLRWITGIRNQKRTANPIPVALRPWVPKNHRRDRAELGAALRAVCTSGQYARLAQRWGLL